MHSNKPHSTICGSPSLMHPSRNYRVRKVCLVLAAVCLLFVCFAQYRLYCRKQRLSDGVRRTAIVSHPFARYEGTNVQGRMCLTLLLRTFGVERAFTKHLRVALDGLQHPSALYVVTRGEELRSAGDDVAADVHGSMIVPHPARSVGSNATLGAMINEALHVMQEDDQCHYMMLLDPTRVPVDHTFFSRMIEDMQHSGAVAASCSTIRDAAAGTLGPATVFDRGFSVLLGQAEGRTLPVVSRNRFGFSTRDLRTQLCEPAHLLSPYCLMMLGNQSSVRVPHAVEGIETTVDTLLSGRSSALETICAVEILHLRQKYISDELSKVSVMALKKMPDVSRTIVRKTFNAVLEAQKELKALHGDQWASRNYTMVLGPRLHDEVMKLQDCHTTSNGNVVAALACMTALMQEQSSIAHRWMHMRTSTSAEEVFGWVLTILLRAQATADQIVVSGATALLDIRGAMPALREFLVMSSKPNPTHILDNPSYTLLEGDTLWQLYQPALVALFPHIHPAARLRVVWDSYCCHCCGFSNEIVHLVLPLQQRGFDVRTPLESECFCAGFPLAVEDSLDRMYMSKTAFPVERLSPNEVVVWVSHTEPTRYENEIFKTRKPDYLVGRSMYEFTKVADDWLKPMAESCDEIWVPAAFVAESFANSGVNPKKLVVVPEAVDAYFFDPQAHTAMELPPRGPIVRWKHFCNTARSPSVSKNFKFFSNFKWEPRKGWDILFSSYFTEFTHNDPVSLYVLTHIWKNGAADNGMSRHNQTYLREALVSLASSLGFGNTLADVPHFCIITDDVSESEVAKLYKSTDAFVLPTRGEGWGLPSIQAMSMGKPVISTAWGGQLEFLREDNSFMIPIDGVEELPKDSEYVWAEGKMWAQPSLNETKRLMRLVVSNATLAEQRAQRARAFVVERFSEEAIVEIVAKRLEFIHRKVLDARRGHRS